MNKICELIYKKIQQKLDTYIKGGQIEEKISLSKAEITLNNVKIKKSALDFLRLPFSMHNSSKIKKVQISMTLSFNPKIKLSIENLHIVINPSVLRHLNHTFLQKEKFAKLQEWEEKQEKIQKNSETSQNTVPDWFVPSVLSRLKLRLLNFTILYQDTEALQILGYPCLCILKFSSLKLKPEKKEETDGVFVVIKLKNLEVNMRCDPLDFEKGTNIDSFYDEIRASERNYVFRPCSFKVNISVSSEDSPNSVLHKISVSVIDEVHLAINEYQRFFIEGLLNFINSSAVHKRYSFLKPKLSIKAAPAEWWKYIISAAKHDRRYHMLSIIRTQPISEKYKELYKRTQRVIQSPVLPGLTEAEAAEMREIEEMYLFEEIVKFRIQALEDIQNKLKHGPDKQEKIKQSIRDFYAEFNGLEEPNESDSEESFSKNTKKFVFTLTVPRVIASMNLLSNVCESEIQFLDTAGCECQRCKIPEMKKKEKSVNVGEEEKQKPRFVRTGLNSANSEHYKIRGPPRHSLLPSRKMRDIAIEYGEEVYNIGSICYKSHSGNAYEPNMMKEKTLLIVILDKISADFSWTGETIEGQMGISSIFAFDPLACPVKDFDCNGPRRLNRLSDLLDFKGWASSLLNGPGDLVKKNKKGKEIKIPRDNKALWSLRHFMKDLNSLPELEFLVHYYEKITGKDFCICKINLKSDQGMQEEFLKPGKNNIHVSRLLKPLVSRKLESEVIANIAMKIQKGLVEIFPYFLRASLRYFISYILPQDLENEPSKIIVKVSKDHESEKYVGLCDICISKIPVFITTSCIANASFFITPQVILGMYSKPLHKSTFFLTLKAVSEKVDLVNTIQNNWDRPSSILLSVLKSKMEKIPKFVLEFHIKSAEVTIFSLINAAEFISPPMLKLKISGLEVKKEKSQPIKKPIKSSTLSSIHHLSISPEFFFTIKGEIQEFSLETTEKLLSASMQLQVSLNPFATHPTIPNNLIDIHIPSVAVNINANLLPFLHILKSIECRLIMNSNIHESNKSLSEVFRIMDTDSVHEFRNMIFANDSKIKGENVAKFGDDHENDISRCKHCLLKFIKILSFVNITVGTMENNDSQGVSLQVVVNNEKVFDIACKHVLCNIEERLFSTKINVFTAEFFGNNIKGENFRLHPGKSFIGVQPNIPIYMSALLPFTFSKYFASGEILAYHIFTSKQLLNCDIINESTWHPSTVASVPKKTFSTLSRMRSLEVDLIENDFKGEIMINLVKGNIIFNMDSLLITGLIHIANTLKLSKQICPMPKKNTFQIKHISKKFAVSLANLQVKVKLGHKKIGILCNGLELTVFPVTSSPIIQQIVITKNKETEVIFTNSVEIKVDSTKLDVSGAFKVVLGGFALKLYEIKKSKVKIVNRVLTAALLEKIEKVNLIVNYVMVKEKKNVIFAIPAEKSRNGLIVSTNKDKIKVNSKIEEISFDLPAAGLIIEVLLLQKILEKLIKFSVPQVDSMPNFADFYIKHPNLLVSHKSNAKIVIFVSCIFLKLSYNDSQILQLKIHQLCLHHNMSQDKLEKFFEARENLILTENIFSESDEIGIIIKNIELTPSDSIYDRMVEMTSDYSLIVKVSLSLKKIYVKVKKPVKVTLINKVFEEFILCLKSIKNIFPKKPPKAGFTVECDIIGGEVILPQNSKSYNHVKATFGKCKVNVLAEMKDLIKPTPIDEDVKLCKEKQVVHDYYENPSPVFCDLISVMIENVQAETFIKKKKKKLGKAANIELDICVPSASEELTEYQWKSDSFVDVRFRDAEIKASMAYFLLLQKTLESNFDEELNHFPKVKKWEKIDMKVSVDSSELEIKQYEEMVVLEIDKKKPADDIQKSIDDIQKSIDDIKRFDFSKPQSIADSSVSDDN